MAALDSDLESIDEEIKNQEDFALVIIVDHLIHESKFYINFSHVRGPQGVSKL